MITYKRPTYADEYILEHLETSADAVNRCRTWFQKIQDNPPDALTYAEYARLQREAEYAAKEMARVELQVRTLLVAFFSVHSESQEEDQP